MLEGGDYSCLGVGQVTTSVNYLFVPVMFSATPFGILLHNIVIHASCSRFLACVNREWLQAVRAVICELRRGFLGSSFHVNCLGHDLHEDTAKRRLCRSLKLHFGNKSKSLPDLTVWGCNTKLYLRHTLVKKQMSFQELLHRCYRFPVYAGYDFELFRGLYRDYNSQNLEEPLVGAAQLFGITLCLSARLGLQISGHIHT